MFVSRLPFLSAGYGVEEDSWGIALAAYNTFTTGIYEPSRFPGHPVHEFIYSAFWGLPPFFYNASSAFFSAIATVFFSLILKELTFKHYFIAALAFAFTPVFYISSTYTIDFVWTIAFILISLYSLLKKYYVLCGVFLGLAIGCRITSGAMLLPFAIIFWENKNFQKNIIIGLKILIPLIVMVFISYLPLMLQFGSSFFMYYDQFPYPSIAKVFYKMIPGVFGFLGVMAILISIISIYVNRKKVVAGELFEKGLEKKIVWSAVAVIVLFTFSYFRLPQKSGYMITIIPFVILLFGYFLNRTMFNFFSCLLILSSFFCSINLTDKLRGAGYSKMAMFFNVSGQELFFDPFSGPIFSDYSKRLQKMKYTDEVIRDVYSLGEKTVIIAGWWYNEIVVTMLPLPKNEHVIFVPYIDAEKMKDYLSKGYTIKYLPEQNIYNDLMYKMDVTNRLASQF